MKTVNASAIIACTAFALLAACSQQQPAEKPKATVTTNVAGHAYTMALAQDTPATRAERSMPAPTQVPTLPTVETSKGAPVAAVIK